MLVAQDREYHRDDAAPGAEDLDLLDVQDEQVRLVPVVVPPPGYSGWSAVRFSYQGDGIEVIGL